MALASLGIDNFTCASDFKALFGARFRLQLGHFALPCIILADLLGFSMVFTIVRLTLSEKSATAALISRSDRAALMTDL